MSALSNLRRRSQGKRWGLPAADTTSNAARFAALTTLAALASFCFSCGPAERTPEGAPPVEDVQRLLDRAGTSLLRRGEEGAREAVDLYREVLRADSANAEARFGLGQAELLTGRRWAGLWNLLRLTRDVPDHAGAWSTLGIDAYKRNANEDAVAALNRLTETRPLRRNELLALADASRRTDRRAAAESLFTVYLERYGDDPRVLASRADVRSERGDLEGAASDYTAALAYADPADPPPAATPAETPEVFLLSADDRFARRVDLASTLVDLNRPDEAAAALDLLSPPGKTSMRGSPLDSVRLHVVRARVEDQAGDYPEALRHLETALAIDSLDAGAANLAVRMRARTGDREGARDAGRLHRKAVERTNRKQRLEALKALTQGGIAIEAADTLAALGAWRKGLEDAPEDLALHCVLAPLFFQLGDRASARESFTVLRQAMGGAPPGPIFLNTAREMRDRGLPKAAAGQFALAVNRMPGNEEALFEYARCLAETGDWDKALRVAAPLEAPPGPPPAPFEPFRTSPPTPPPPPTGETRPGDP